MVCLCLYLFIMVICPFLHHAYCIYPNVRQFFLIQLKNLIAAHKVKDIVHKYFFGN